MLKSKMKRRTIQVMRKKNKAKNRATYKKGKRKKGYA